MAVADSWGAPNLSAASTRPRMEMQSLVIIVVTTFLFLFTKFPLFKSYRSSSDHIDLSYLLSWDQITPARVYHLCIPGAMDRVVIILDLAQFWGLTLYSHIYHANTWHSPRNKVQKVSWLSHLSHDQHLVPSFVTPTSHYWRRVSIGHFQIVPLAYRQCEPIDLKPWLLPGWHPTIES